MLYVLIRKSVISIPFFSITATNLYMMIKLDQGTTTNDATNDATNEATYLQSDSAKFHSANISDRLFPVFT